MADTTKLVKRFYKQASHDEERHCQILLDGRPVKTPGGKMLCGMNVALANELIAEWEAQEEFVDPGTMPMTALAYAVTDSIAPRRAEVIERLFPFIDTDALRYPDAGKSDLAELQGSDWTPLRNWFQEKYKIEVSAIDDLSTRAIDPDSLTSLQKRFAEIDDYALAALNKLVHDTGSLILGVALLDKRIGGQEAFELALLEELHQVKSWGQDAAAEDRRALIKRDILAAECFIQLSLKA